MKPDFLKHFIYGPEIAIFHEFRKPPYGGGNTFLIALEKEFKKLGRDVGRNKVGKHTKVILFNSYNFDFNKLENLARKYPQIKMVHRVDGPVSVYRGSDIKIDKEIWEMNHKLANATIFQSKYSFDKHIELGLHFKNSAIIPNASDPEIFHRRNRLAPPDGQRKVKLITTVWSDNIKKGGPLLSWLNDHLDHSRYELTLLGRVKEEFKGAHVNPPVGSEDLGELLRQHDIYIAPSQDDPASNSLVEALTSGLPAVYLRSGGHPELVGGGGEAFTGESDVLEAIDKVARNYKTYQDKIRILSLKEVTAKYLEVFDNVHV